MANVSTNASGQAATSEVFVLEVLRGRTTRSLRPIRSTRYLIGASPRCDLRLGGDDIPPFHSMIVRTGNEFWVEAVAPSPVLLVNGSHESFSRLADNDRVQIGCFEFTMHCKLAPSSEGVAPEAQAPAADDRDGLREPLGDLSAAVLIERIEAATRLVNEFEHRERLGLEALLHTLGQRSATLMEGSRPSDLLPLAARENDVERRMLGDLESLVLQLSEIVRQFHLQSSAQRRREAGHEHAVSSILEIQDRLSRQFETLLQQVAALRQNHAPTRAIA